MWLSSVICLVTLGSVFCGFQTFGPVSTAQEGDTTTSVVDSTVADNSTTLQDKGQSDYNGTADYHYDYYEDEDLEMTLMDHAIWVTSVPGVIFNTITIIVVSRIKPFSTNNLFILFLGATDLVNVVFRIVSTVCYLVEYITDLNCKILDFIIITTFNYSNLILVCWTFERFVAVWFPTKYAVYCTFRNSLIALLITGGALCLLGIPYLVGAYTHVTEFGYAYCEYSQFLYIVWTPIETSYYIWIPMVTICVLNVLIVHRLVSVTRLSQSLSSERAEQRANEQRQMAKVLVCVCIAFLILHLPQAIVTVYLSVSAGKIEVFVADPFGPLKSLRWSFVFTEFQNSINFFLYCLTGRVFRAYVREMFGGCRRGQVAENESMPPHQATKVTKT